MALRATETGGQQDGADRGARTEPLPTRLYPVSRMPTGSQLKKQRREEKKRNRQRARTTGKRAARAAERAAKHAEVQAQRLARHERRAAKEAENPHTSVVTPTSFQRNVEEHRPPLEETALLRVPSGQKLASGMQEPSPNGARESDVPAGSTPIRETRSFAPAFPRASPALSPARSYEKSSQRGSWARLWSGLMKKLPV